MKFIMNGEEIGITPSLSNAGYMSVVELTLSVDGWSEENTQEVSVPEILADVKKQLIIPMPAEGNEDICEASGIKPLEQSDGVISFYAKNIPEEDVGIVLFIFEDRNVDSGSTENYVPESEVTT